MNTRESLPVRIIFTSKKHGNRQIIESQIITIHNRIHIHFKTFCHNYLSRNQLSSFRNFSFFRNNLFHLIQIQNCINLRNFTRSRNTVHPKNINAHTFRLFRTDCNITSIILTKIFFQSSIYRFQKRISHNNDSYTKNQKQRNNNCFRFMFS